MVVCDPLTDLYNPNLIRSSIGAAFSVPCVACDSAECIRFLTGTEGNILLTTGSKTVPEYCAAPGLRERIWARLLPLPSSLESCREGGLEPSHILAMQGPFTEELNTAMLRFVNAKWLVTKDTGSAGGYADKIAAARAAGAKAVIIGRPAEREGLSGAETLSAVERKFALAPARKKVIMAGIGMGSEDTRTLGVLRAVAEAECVIGARRMVQSVDTTGKRVCEAVLARDIAAIVREGSERVYTVLLSGDTGFYSGAKSLLRELGDETDNEVLPGIGSLTYFCARLKRPWENVRAISLHGRRCDFVREVRYNAAVFSLLGGEVGAKEALRMLADAGLGGVTVHIGENLGYPEERIVSGTAEELLDREFAPLCVLLAENARADDEPVTYGLPDEAFDRDKVPMTKEEVRGVCVSKLALGTGRNAEKFGLINLEVVPGTAPEALVPLPAPTHAFIGGSSGNMREIVELLLEKNPKVRIVATAVTLETLSELTELLKEFEIAECVELQVNRPRTVGRYHLFNAQNPVYIFTFQYRKQP